MDKFREAQEQFEAKELEILGLQSTNENKGLKPRPRPPLTIKSIVTSPCSRPVKNELRWRPGMETSGYENPLHDSVPHTPAREAHQDQHRTRDGGDRRCLISQMSWNMSDQDPRTRQRQGHGQVKTRGRTGTRTRPDLTFKDYPLLWGRYRTASATWKQKPGSPTPRSITRRPSTDAERTRRTSASSFNGLNSKPLEDLVAWRRDTDDQGNAKPLGDYSGNDPEQMHSRTDNKTKRGATDFGLELHVGSAERSSPTWP